VGFFSLKKVILPDKNNPSYYVEYIIINSVQDGGLKGDFANERTTRSAANSSALRFFSGDGCKESGSAAPTIFGKKRHADTDFEGTWQLAS
jgi:hypothetical protein